MQWDIKRAIYYTAIPSGLFYLMVRTIFSVMGGEEKMPLPAKIVLGYIAFESLTSELIDQQKSYIIKLEQEAMNYIIDISNILVPGQGKKHLVSKQNAHMDNENILYILSNFIFSNMRFLFMHRKSNEGSIQIELLTGSYDIINANSTEIFSKDRQFHITSLIKVGAKLANLYERYAYGNPEFGEKCIAYQNSFNDLKTKYYEHNNTTIVHPDISIPGERRIL